MYNKFFNAVMERKTLLFCDNTRQTGKTTLINKLGFELQALGYIVCMHTPFKQQEFVVNRFVDEERDLRGLDRKRIVVLVDDVIESNLHFKDLVLYCEYSSIPIVGFTRLSI